MGSSIKANSPGGDWSNSDLWNGGVPDSAVADAVLGAAGRYTVTIGDETETVDTATLEAAGATLDLAAGGALDLARPMGLLSLGEGTLFLGAGTIVGGTIAMVGGTMLSDNGTLDGVTVVGTITPFDAVNQVLNIVGGLTMDGGVLDLEGGSSDALNVLDSETLDHLTINIGDGTNYGNGYSDQDAIETAASATLTFGVFATIAEIAQSDVAVFGGTIINDGTLLAGGSILVVAAPVFVNAGDLVDQAMVQDNSATFINAGTISIAAGADFQNSGATFDNAGSIVLGSDSTLLLGGTEALAALGRITANTATLAIFGRLDLGGDTILVGPTGLIGDMLLDYGELVDGTMVPAGGTLAIAGSVSFDGFTYAGSLAVTSGAIIEALGGLVDIGGAVGGNGSLLIGAGASLELGSADSEKIVFRGATGDLRLDDPGAISAALISLAPGDTIELTGLGLQSAAISGSTLAITTPGSTFGFALASAAPVRIALSGEAATFYGLAQPTLVEPSPATLADQHVAGAPNESPALLQGLEVRNAAPAGGYSEFLDATIGAGGAAIVSGTVDQLGAGLTNPGGLALGVSDAAAGTISGDGLATLYSDGGTLDGLTPLELGTQDIPVSGKVFRYAAPGAITPDAVVFANHHVGDSVVDTLALSNGDPADGYSENLDATALATGGIVVGGAVSGLAAGGTSDGLTIAEVTQSAGAIAGTAIIGLISDGSTIDGLGTTALASQTIAASGNVFAYATLDIGSQTIDFGSTRVGDDPMAAGVTIANGSVADAYRENLDVSAAGAPFGYVESEPTSFSLTAGGTGVVTLQLVTTTAGEFINGTVGIGAVSDGTGLDGLGTTALPGTAVVLDGTIFAAATADLAATTLALGITHVGMAVSASVAVSNVARGALVDTLAGGFGSLTGGFLASGSLAVTAGHTGTLTIGLNAASPGVFGGTADLELSSHDGELPDLAVAAPAIVYSGTVDSYATATFAEIGGGGTLSGSGTAFALDVGTLALGSAADTVDLAVVNAAIGNSDLLSGGFVVAAGTGFASSGFGSFDGVTAGSSIEIGSVTLATELRGRFSEAVTLDAAGSNASPYFGALAPEVLTITGQVACYGAGTMILTPSGELAVEHLAIGDRVVTRSGAARPIRWIGWRSYGGRFVTGNRNVLPIVIRCGALAEGMPSRDLTVSPRHGMYLDGVLIPAERLVNDRSVVQLAQVSELSYFHIELDSHDVLVADGAPAESYVDCDNRGMFQNAHAFAARYPEGLGASWAFCATRLDAGPIPSSVGARVATRSKFFPMPGVSEQVLYVTAPGSFRATIRAGTTKLHVISQSGIPPGERRNLGAAVSRLALDGVPLGLDDAAFGRGFHAIEREAERAWRWTDGAAVLWIEPSFRAREFVAEIVSVAGAASP